ncbi:hypothetical protein, partial [Klebsiella pneumoniae]|uniref:hypothetical protein n=1 Tax=Klebsiella pneumoniae TaxID=573 RepID=UPI001C0C3A2D
LFRTVENQLIPFNPENGRVSILQPPQAQQVGSSSFFLVGFILLPPLPSEWGASSQDLNETTKRMASITILIRGSSHRQQKNMRKTTYP